MSLKANIGPQLPLLRRYARALTGSQSLGDAAVREVLEALLAAPQEFNDDVPARQELYRIFHQLWGGMISVQADRGLVASLSSPTRQALLLTTIEEFTVEQAATILGATVAAVHAQIDAARAAIADILQSNVMIIEDEAIIALHLKSIVEGLGHDIAGIARTHGEAVAMAARTQPELVLADISLADGSSGIDAVKEILELSDVPVIFVTAFPERLLTGDRPEPAYLITKPFSPETVSATIGQALFVHRERASMASSPAAQAMGAEVPNPRRHFDSPKALLTDPDLPDAEKHALLTEWSSEIDRRLESESEGMSVSEPMTARKEGRLADEARQVQSALSALTARMDLAQ